MYDFLNLWGNVALVIVSFALVFIIWAWIKYKRVYIKFSKIDREIYPRAAKYLFIFQIILIILIYIWIIVYECFGFMAGC